ncbi:MAG: ROK family protein [Candidatus Marsarchaeota archaeon]|nr:ROK family protein [Candidatus Marsarchaeota archaeon]
MEKMEKKIAAIEIGATTLKIAATDLEGRNVNLLYKERSDAEHLVQQITKVLDKFGDIFGIGVCAPGPIDVNSGMIFTPANLKIKDLNIVDLLEHRYDAPTFLYNDAVAGVLGEKNFGAGKKAENLVYVSISTGLGCGVIANGRVLSGKMGNAHEVGHCVIDANSTVKCGCGGLGHWEAFCSGNGIPNFAKFLLETKYKGRNTRLRNIKKLSAKDVFDMAKKDDEIAKEIIEEVGRLNAIGIGNIINVYEPELITLGGSVAVFNIDAVLNPIKRLVKEYAFNPVPEIMITPLRSTATLLGTITELVSR